MRLSRRLSSVLSCGLAAIVLLLVLSRATVLAAAVSDVPAPPTVISPSGSASACYNDCSGQGVCSSAGRCQCSTGYLGSDCSLASSMPPVCWSSTTGSLCAQWQLDTHQTYFRITAVTNPSGGSGTAAGWAGMLFGTAADGMTNGTGFYVSVDPTSQTPTVVDVWAARRGRPSAASVQTAVNVTGFANSTGIDVSFQRPLAAVDAQHFAIPASTGVMTAVSVGTATSTFTHHAWAQRVSIDFASAAAASAGCPNQCSSRGTCATVGSSSLCQCDAGYLGADCSIASGMTPLCWAGQGGSSCAYWQLSSQQIYFRLVAVTNPTGSSGIAAGWAGMLFGTADDGMSNGKGVYVSMNSTSQLPYVVDIYTTKPGRPNIATIQTATNVTGFGNSTTIDVSFQRPLAAVDTQHYAIPAAAGSVTAVSVATAPTTFVHHVWAQRVSIDIAAVSSAPQCANGCSGHGTCSPAGTCICNSGYLGTDCHVQSLMDSICPNGAGAQPGAYCMYWRIVDGIYYHRIIAVTNPTAAPNSAAPGWAGILWDNEDGNPMAQGKVVVVSVPQPYQPTVQEMYAEDTVQPAVDDVQTITPYNVTGWSNATTIDVSFQRYCYTNLSQHYSIPTLVGGLTSVGVAWHNEPWSSGDQHQWAQSLGKLDLVATMDPDASCLNGCSGNGRCVGSGANARCHCQESWLGVDCSVTSTMQKQCRQGENSTGSLCAQWQLDSQQIYFRITAVTNPAGSSNGTAAGWAGMLFGTAADGMTNGTGFYVSVDPTSQTPTVVDVWAARRGRPSAASVQTAVNVTGFANSTGIDVSFQRPLAAVDAQHFAIPASAGAITPVSVAWGPMTFSKHAWAQRVLIDIAADAAGPGCLNDCSGHGECKSSTCQCQDEWLGADCSVAMAYSLCPFNSDFCFKWTIVASQIYLRVRAAITPTGWAGLMFHPTSDGMTDGQLLLFTPLAGSTPAAVTEMISTGHVTPTRLANATQLVTAADITAYNTDSYADISFVRPCHPTDTSLLDIETQAGVTVPMSWAIKPSSAGVFTQHALDSNVVGMFTVDWVSGDVVVAQSRLFNYYMPVIVMLGVIVFAGLILRLPFVVHSSVGRCCLRKRVSSIGAKSYELSSKHAVEKTPLTYSPDDDAALVVQSDDSRTITSHTAALFNALDFATLNVCSTVYHMTVGELLVVLLYLAGLAEFALLARRTLQLDIVFGHLTAINLTLAVLPVTRRSVWHFAFGLSFERAIKWHRFVARMAVLSMLGHALVLIDFNGLGVLLHTAPLKHGIAAIFGTLAGSCMLLMSLSAFEPVRRRVFEAFWYVHIPLFMSTVVFAALHSEYARYYLIAPVGLYLVDWLLRFSNTARSVTVVESAVLADAGESFRVGRLTVSASMTPTAGQYVFVNLPAVSLLQWHPFSVSSVPEPAAGGKGATFSVHMLDMGKSTFTGAACDLIASSAYANQPIQVRLDGPFGNLSIPHTDYPTLVFVAGGIGITPIASLLGDVLASQGQSRVVVVWTCRHSDYFYSLFPELLSQLQRDSRVSLHLFDTGSRGSARVVKSGMDDSLLARDTLQLPEEKHQHIDTLSTGSTSSSFMSTGANLGQPHLHLDISNGRPHLPALFSRVAREHQSLEDNGKGRAAARGGLALLGAAGVGVVCCGPSALLTDVESESMRFGFHLHKETFAL